MISNHFHRRETLVAVVAVETPTDVSTLSMESVARNRRLIYRGVFAVVALERSHLSLIAGHLVVGLHVVLDR